MLSKGMNKSSDRFQSTAKVPFFNVLRTIRKSCCNSMSLAEILNLKIPSH